MKYLLLILFFGLLSFTDTSAEIEESCFPKSKFRYGKNMKNFNGGINEFEFNQLIERVKKNMEPMIYAQTKKKVIFEKNWSDDEVNAHATRDEDDNLIVMLTGGLARHPLMTKDAFMLIICHEIGHYLGGAPKQFRGNTTMRSWSSVEGQADYFATTKCLPVVFQDKTETKILDRSVLPEVKRKAYLRCDNDLCARIVVAGLQISSVFASLKEGVQIPDLLSSDKSIVEKTLTKHPAPQCRLDTFVMGANCDARWDEPFNDLDPKAGACLFANKNARPLCWYKDE